MLRSASLLRRTPASLPVAALCFSSSRAFSKEASPQIVVYQYDVCPFCNKVKAFLDLKNIPYTAVEVNPLSKAQLKEVTDYKMVPYAVVNGEGVEQSAGIIDHISQIIDGDEAVRDEEEQKWINWVDDTLVHIFTANIYRTPAESLQSFNYISEQSNFSVGQQFMAKYSGAVLMYLITNLKLKKKYGIEDGKERETLYEAVNEWTAAVDSAGTPFLGGTTPNLADVSVFGVLRALEGYDTFGEMMDNTSLGPWYSEMQVQVGGPSRTNPV